ncbi:MAG: hypothetical protein AAFQ58_14020 [Pseudomonadota bacterium]
MDLAAFLDLVEAQAHDQRAALKLLAEGASAIETANHAVDTTATDLVHSVDRTYQDVGQSVVLMRDLGARSRDIAA